MIIRQSKRQYVYLVVIFTVLVLGALIFLRSSGSENSFSSDIPVYVADSSSERVLGLSGREGLPDGYGMLFIFDSAEKHGIWMKNMKFNIDVVWLDDKKVVVETVENIEPKSYPKKFVPTVDALYILEMPAGQIDARNISKGTQLSFTTVVD